jgi:hypothetical protein
MPEIGNEGYAKDWEPDAEALKAIPVKGKISRPAQATIK